MKTRLSILLLSICLSSNICAQEPAPKLLQDAAQCLVAKTFLQPSRLDLGYLMTTKDWPGEEVVYVVAYTGRSRSEGFVFTIFVTQKNQRRVFDIQNNAKFVRTRKDPSGIDFVEAPLGGIWTQEHLMAAIKRIEEQPRFEIHVNELSRVPSPDSCHSYVDSFVDRK